MNKLGPYTMRLVSLHLFIIALSNWLVTFPVNLLGFDMTWAAFSFPLIVVATDLTIRMIGKQEARKIVAIAYIPAIAVSMLIVGLTGAPTSVAIRIGVASATAYLLGNLLDVYVFQKVRERFSHWWAAPALSSVFANILDTYTFFAVAFYESADAFMNEHWVALATSQVLIKIVISAVVILPTYGVLLKFLTGKLGSNTKSCCQS